ncbi:hypothetical protein [Haladaptatus sp. DYF46]|uniref:DUF7344 domain-containing protein n=1 Tax=Haladaptatus sp. DYF46 TaxID=2886041 RepID=UPI001E2E4D04|nr:hypothetical protein [Haladaptatus sp. DYF46]
MSTPQSTSSGNLSKEQVVGLLGHEQRRAIITYFDQKTTDRASVDDLVEYIVSSGLKRKNPSAEHRERVRIGLFHNHLPRLADAGVLEYDQRSETVRYWGDSRLETLLKVAPSDEYPI